MQVGDIISWDTVNGIKSGKIMDYMESDSGIDYLVRLKGDKCVWVNEKSVKTE